MVSRLGRDVAGWSAWLKETAIMFSAFLTLHPRASFDAQELQPDCRLGPWNPTMGVVVWDKTENGPKQGTCIPELPAFSVGHPALKSRKLGRPSPPTTKHDPTKPSWCCFSGLPSPSIRFIIAGFTSTASHFHNLAFPSPFWPGKLQSTPDRLSCFTQES
jgi:hypothetical protein